MVQKRSKLTKSALHLSHYEHIFRCPICQSAMKIVDLKSLMCHQNHTFDIARQGHINLLTRSIQSNYSKQLFSARRKVIVESPLFKPFTKEMAKLISKHTSLNSDVKMIDMGTGEGSHLQNICNTLDHDYNKTLTGFGMDISREGILEAAKHYEEMIWLVADIANSPFKNNGFDMILNILSPSNYHEFKRLLHEDGLVVKVVPGEHYLQELRNYFYKSNEKQAYSNEIVVNSFKENFQVIDHSMMDYQKNLNQPMLKSLLQMTPLTWNITDEKIQHFIKKGTPKITVHLEILIGK